LIENDNYEDIVFVDISVKNDRKLNEDEIVNIKFYKVTKTHVNNSKSSTLIFQDIS
jgi:hypothetical protein